MKLLGPRRTGVFFLMILLVTAEPASASHRYNITVIGVLPGTSPEVAARISVTARGINDKGEVVGDAVGTLVEYAYLLKEGLMVNLGLPGNQPKARRINGQTMVVGEAQLPGSAGYYHAFLWQHGSYQDLTPGPDATSRANDINELGQIVGETYRFDRSSETTIQAAVLWDAGNTTEIASGWAYGINNIGQVVVERSGLAFLWEMGTFTDLVRPPGAVEPYGQGARGINDHGQIVGNSSYPSGSRAAVWDQGTITDLGHLPWRNSWSLAVDINNAGQIIGNVSPPADSGSTVRPVLWEHGQVFDLNDLIDQQTNFIMLEASDINNLGQIVGTGVIYGQTQTRGFLLTPIPLPTPFRRADTNADGEHDLSDAVGVLLYLFAGTTTTCLDAMDANDDGVADVSDAIGYLAFVFNSGFAPPEPFVKCDTDPTLDNLSCESFVPCVE